MGRSTEPRQIVHFRRQIVHSELEQLIQVSPPAVAQLFTLALDRYLAGHSRYAQKQSFQRFDDALEEHQALLRFPEHYTCSCGEWGLPATESHEGAAKRHLNHRAGALLAALADAGLLDLVTNDPQHIKES